MVERIIIPKIVLMCSLLFYIYNYGGMSLYSNIIHTDDLKSCNSYLLSSKDDKYDVDESKVIAEIPSSKIKLYYVKKDDDFNMYRGFVLQINDVKRYFKWECVDNPTYAPKLILSDLDKDGKDELIILLNKGCGTGLNEGEIHVIKQDVRKQEPFFYEILVENPLIRKVLIMLNL